MDEFARGMTGRRADAARYVCVAWPGSVLPFARRIVSQIRTINSVTAAANGRGGEIILSAALGAGREVELKLPGRYTLDAALRGALRSAPGVTWLEDV